MSIKITFLHKTYSLPRPLQWCIVRLHTEHPAGPPLHRPYRERVDLKPPTGLSLVPSIFVLTCIAKIGCFSFVGLECSAVVVWTCVLTCLRSHLCSCSPNQEPQTQRASLAVLICLVTKCGQLNSTQHQLNALVYDLHPCVAFFLSRAHQETKRNL